MECQKIANLLDHASNQPSKFRIKYWLGINDESRRTYKAKSNLKLTKSSLKLQG